MYFFSRKVGARLLILLITIGYLLGSIPFALIIGKVFYQTDIRQHGSGNLGGTNTFRTLGKKAGIAVTLGDVLKGSLAFLLPTLFSANVEPLLIGLAAIIGHSYPIFANFKGGKSVATSIGVLLVANPLSFSLALLIFFSSLKITKYVSLSSIIALASVALFSLITTDIAMQLFTIPLFLFIVFKHRSNLERIKNKSEPKVSWI